MLLIENKWLEELSITDPVTQLTNHRYFQERLKIETEEASATATLSVLR